jgi:hypothetical protein
LLTAYRCQPRFISDKNQVRRSVSSIQTLSDSLRDRIRGHRLLIDLLLLSQAFEGGHFRKLKISFRVLFCTNGHQCGAAPNGCVEVLWLSDLTDVRSEQDAR